MMHATAVGSNLWLRCLETCAKACVWAGCVCMVSTCLDPCALFIIHVSGASYQCREQSRPASAATYNGGRVSSPCQSANQISTHRTPETRAPTMLLFEAHVAPAEITEAGSYRGDYGEEEERETRCRFDSFSLFITSSITVFITSSEASGVPG